jgi:hypothetical protein
MFLSIQKIVLISAGLFRSAMGAWLGVFQEFLRKAKKSLVILRDFS